ncbi:cyclic nucleotide-binding domain-containing thioredoxin-disulfide reductase [Actinomadura sp. DC4]|uniref:FAD-dependent oxidoreductase n=1 Tax=Actinomadura sp. DC4 TaxID=3055069 RepID=UPI0025AECE88|nr:cyclic nucleotide-binding domain-containing thioredoxin-disulfide reductase [Actinomadura sp. DC4]MDN3357267.1 FAD-dependent oxidoreductase [Actinomadura sp. DC4]
MSEDGFARPGPRRDETASGEPTLSEEQFRRLAGYGRRESVEAGQVLYAGGDHSYDLVLLETAAAQVVREATLTEPGQVIYDRRPGEFLGELNLLTGQTVYLTARVTTAGTVSRVDPAALRRALAEQSDITDVLLEAFRVRREIMRTSAGEALEIVARPDEAGGRALRAYVTRLNLPHSWLDATSATGRAVMRAAGVEDEDLPIAVVGGEVLRGATPGTIGEALGLSFDADRGEVDLVIVGAGPAGLAAAVYGASEGLVTVLFDRAGPGGQAATSSRIENYLGFPGGISGEELTRRAMLQALKFGTAISTPCEVTGLDLADAESPVVTLQDGVRVRARAVIVTTGARYRRLDVPRWSEFEDAGHIRYSATELDLRGCESQPVTVIGGANSAGQAALFLASRGSSVDMVIRAAVIENGMSAYLADRVRVHPRIRVRVRSEIRALDGDDGLEAVVVEGPEGRRERLESRVLFCFIGAEPASGWLDGLALDDHGFVLTDSRLPAGTSASPLPFQTSAPRVFAAGDVRSGSMKRVASAVGEGAGAVAAVHTALTPPAHR